MTEVIGQNFPHRKTESLGQREKLSDEQMGNILSAVGNHEAKAITLILMRGGNIFNRRDLHSMALNAQGEHKGWKMGNSIPFRYCSDSLAPIGLVAKETLNEDLSTYGYAITEDGKVLGIPLAGLLLDLSERHNISLNQLFGSTQSPSQKKTTLIDGEENNKVEWRKRAPSTTLKIFYELLTSPNLPIRTVDIEEALGERNMEVIPTHLNRLSKLGMIQYDAIEVNKPYSAYKLSTAVPEGELPIYKRTTSLTREVFDVLKKNPDQYLTSEQIVNLLTEGQKEGWKNKKNLRDHISRTLSFLSDQKYATVEKFNHTKQSEINLTTEQRVVLTELLEIMYRFQNQDEEILEKGKRLAEAIISNPTRVSNLLGRAKEASSNASGSPANETQNIALSFILVSPGITNKEIQIELENKHDKKIGISMVAKLTRSLLKQGSIRVEKKGPVNIFFPN